MLHRVLVGMTVLALGSAVQAQSTRSYRADARSTASVDLSLCSAAVSMVVRGDGDTDLDFTVKDNFGRVIHQDNDRTDRTWATLRPGVSPGNCATFTLHVKNLGNVYNSFSVALTNVEATAATATRGSRDGRDRRVAIHNHTAENFAEIRFSNTADRGYGPNRLGSGILQARHNRTFDMDDGTGACRFDVMVKTSGGRTYTRNDVNVCTSSTIEFGTEISHSSDDEVLGW